MPPKPKPLEGGGGSPLEREVDINGLIRPTDLSKPFKQTTRVPKFKTAVNNCDHTFIHSYEKIKTPKTCFRDQDRCTLHSLDTTAMAI